MYATIIRRFENDKQTLGWFTLFEQNSVVPVLQFYVLELDDDGNQRRISRIPAGLYKVVLRTSRKYGTHYHIQDVAGRTLILIHVGNTYHDTLGCLLPGMDLSDINNDNHTDVIQSRTAMNKLLAAAGDCFMLEIFDRTHE